MEMLHNIIEFIKSHTSRKKQDPYGEEEELYEDEEINESLVYEVNNEPETETADIVEEFSESTDKPEKQLPLAKVIKALATVFFFIAVLVTGYVLYPFGGDAEEKPQPIQKVEKQQPEQEAAKVADSAISPVNELALALKKNPFIEATAIQVNPETGSNNPVAQSQGSSGNRVSYTASSLPAIPNNYPRPRIPMPGQFNVPAAENQPAAESAPPSGGSVSVQGVLTGEDGHNMAIMSDGSVISEGETFQDGRIAYIGGDGITFEDGNKLKY